MCKWKMMSFDNFLAMFDFALDIESSNSLFARKMMFFFH